MKDEIIFNPCTVFLLLNNDVTVNLTARTVTVLHFYYILNAAKDTKKKNLHWNIK